MALATGQFTIIDYNDAISLSGFIGSNRQKNVSYFPDTKTSTPEYSTSNLTLTPSLFGAGVTYSGNPADILSYYLGRITKQTWYYSADGGARVQINTTDTTTILTNGTSDSSVWTVSLGAAGTPGTPPTLTIKKNPFGAAGDSPGGPGLAQQGITYIYECVYTDPNMTGLPLKFTQTFDSSKVTNAASIATANCWAPNGTIFKNTLVPNLTAQCDLWRGATTDNTTIQYYWYKNDSSGNTTSTGAVTAGAKTIPVTSGAAFYVGQMIGITDGTHTDIVGPLTVAGSSLTWTAGSGLTYGYASGSTIFDGSAGNGWRLIVNNGWAGNITGASSTAGGVDGTNTITIPSAAVVNYGTFKCGIKDVDTLSPTYGQYFWDTITFNDQTDPVSVNIISTNGDVFKNAIGSTILIAKVYQNGAEFDTLTGGAEPANVVNFGLSANRPATPTNPSWYMATDTGVFTKYTGTWGAALSALSTSDGGPYSKKYIWSVRDTNGANVNFGNTSSTASPNYTDAACTTQTASSGTVAGPYRKGKWILINDVDVTGKNTFQCDVQ